MILMVCQVVSGGTSPPSGPAPLGDRQVQRAWVLLPLHCTAPLPWGIFSNSNKASQPNACPLIFATVIHPLAVLSAGCLVGRSLHPLSLQGQVGGGQDNSPSSSPSCAFCPRCSKCISSWARP